MRNIKKILSTGKRLKRKKQNWLIFLKLFILHLKKHCKNEEFMHCIPIKEKHMI